MPRIDKFRGSIPRNIEEYSSESSTDGSYSYYTDDESYYDDADTNR